jgi:hypothetical protein
MEICLINYLNSEYRNNVPPTYSPRKVGVWSLGVVLINMYVSSIFTLTNLTDFSLGCPLLNRVLPLCAFLYGFSTLVRIRTHPNSVDIHPLRVVIRGKCVYSAIYTHNNVLRRTVRALAPSCTPLPGLSPCPL